MNYKIYPSENGKYIVLKAVGEITRERAMRNNIEAHKMGKKMGIKRYLVDMEEAQNVDSISDQYEFANRDIPLSPEIDKTAIVAVLVSKNDHSHDFIETVSVNAGLNVKLFTDRNKALKFISGE